MTDARYTVYIDKAYRNYVNKCNEDKWMKEVVLNLPFPNKSYGLFSHEEFISKCQTDDDFANRWGCKIEIKELSLSERTEYKKKRDGIARTFSPYTHQILDGSNIPTKLITVIYNNEKIESYV